MDFFDFSYGSYEPELVSFEGNGGSTPDLDAWLEQLEQDQQGELPGWVDDAYWEGVELLLQDPEINQLLAQNLNTQLSDNALLLLENQVRAEAVQNNLNGDYDAYVERVERYAGSSSAWESANDFPDIYLDWGDSANLSYEWGLPGDWWDDDYGLY